MGNNGSNGVLGRTVGGSPVRVTVSVGGGGNAGTGTAAGSGAAGGEPTLAQELELLSEALQAAERALEVVAQVFAGQAVTPLAATPPAATRPAVPPPAAPPSVTPPPVTTPPDTYAADQALSMIQYEAGAVAAADDARVAELDRMVKDGQIDAEQAQAERLKLQATGASVRELAQLAASLPKDRNPEAPARFERLHELLTMVANGQIDGEMARAEVYRIAQSLRLPASDAPGPLSDARAQGTSALAEANVGKTEALEKLRELQNLVANGEIDAQQALREAVVYQDRFRGISAIEAIVSRMPLDVDPDAAKQLERLRELQLMIHTGQVYASDAAAEIYEITQHLTRPALFPNGQPTLAVRQAASDIQRASDDKTAISLRSQAIEEEVFEGKLTAAQGDAEQARLAQRAQADDQVVVKYGLPVGLAGLTYLDTRL